MNISSSKGFSFVETIIALGVLTTGVMGAAAVLVSGMQNLSSSPGDVIVTQKAAQAVETVFSARDSHKLTWTQIKNVSSGGIFLDGAQPMKLAGNDGLVNTADDTTVETITFPGKDQVLGTPDDMVTSLTGYTRQIAITDVPSEGGQLRSIVVTIQYRNGPTLRTYRLTTFISTYS